MVFMYIYIFLSKNNAFLACLHFPETEMDQLLTTKHSQFLMFPETSVTGKCRSASKHDFSDKNVLFFCCLWK